MFVYPRYLHVLAPLFPTLRSAVRSVVARAQFAQPQVGVDGVRMRVEAHLGREAQLVGVPGGDRPLAGGDLRKVVGVGVRPSRRLCAILGALAHPIPPRSEEHTSELQSLMRTSYAVFCLKKK